jgi:hypothetical protein
MSAKMGDHDDGKQVCQLPEICLDIPSFHYYQSVDDHLRSGRCGFDEALQWLLAMEKHHEQISHVFCGYIANELLRRDPSIKAGSFKVTPGAGHICLTIRQSLEKHTYPSVHEVLDILSVHEPGWTSFMRFVPEKERPHDFRSLGHLFYVYQVVRHAFGDGSRDKPM